MSLASTSIVTDLFCIVATCLFWTTGNVLVFIQIATPLMAENALSAAELNKLATNQLKNLNARQLNRLNASQLNRLDQAQIKQLTPSNVDKLNPAQAQKRPLV
ncbi:MAG: hypothetical protein ACI9LM_005061 [Alteromonadaceae bacterium]|jgi:hypothetical protein